MIETEIIQDAEELRNIASEWNDLLQNSSCNCLFLTWEWMSTCWEHLSGDRKLHVILVRHDGLLIAIAPLVLCPPRVERLMPFRTMEFLGSGNVGSDYLSFLVRTGYEDEGLREIVDCLNESNHMLELVRVDVTSLPMRAMTGKIRRAGWDAASEKITRCPYIDLSGLSWETYVSTLDKSHQKYLARKLRKLNKDFSVEMTTAATEQECEQALDFLIRMHMDRWSRRGGSTAFNRMELVDFHRHFSKVSLDRGWLRLHTLRLDGVIVAVIYIFRYNDIAYYYQMGFDASYEKYSVGMLMLALAIQAAIAEGAVEFDLLHDDEAYKYLWAHENRELVRLEYYPPDVFGRIQYQLNVTKSGIKQLLNNVNISRKACE